MKESKISESQKAAQRKYDQKTQMISVKYTPADMHDYERLKTYLGKTGKSTNKFIKELISEFFESGRGEIYEKPLEKRFHSTENFYKYVDIHLGDVTPMIDYFGKVLMQRLLWKYEKSFKDLVISEREEREEKLLVWINQIIERIEKGEFENYSKMECYQLLETEMMALLEQ